MTPGQRIRTCLSLSTSLMASTKAGLVHSTLHKRLCSLEVSVRGTGQVVSSIEAPSGDRMAVSPPQSMHTHMLTPACTHSSRAEAHMGTQARGRHTQP